MVKTSQNRKFRLGECLRKCSFSSFSWEKKISATGCPSLRISQNTMMLPKNSPSIHKTLPHTPPKAYPPQISRGSPGMMATTTCSMHIPT